MIASVEPSQPISKAKRFELSLVLGDVPLHKIEGLGISSFRWRRFETVGFHTTRIVILGARQQGSAL